MGIRNVKFVSFIVDNTSFDLNISNIINLKNFYFKILNSKNLIIKDSKVRIKDDDNILSVIKIKNLIINSKDDDGTKKLIVNTNVFNMYIGGEFMIGRKSLSTTMAFHSVYLMPAISIKDKVLLSTRLGITQLNTDDPDFLFKWNGYLASFGIEYNISDNMSLGVSYTSYDMHNKEIEGRDMDLTYDKVGLSVIYGFAIVNKKERNEKK